MRKRFLAIVAVLAIVAMALSACSKNTDNTKKPSEGDKPAAQQPAKEAVLNTAWAYEVPPKTHFNPFATGTLNFPGGMFVDLMTSPLALYQWSDNTYVPQLATEWKVDDKAATITVKLRQGVKWSDGTEFKAQDVGVYMSVAKAKAYAITRYIDKFTIKGDYEVEFHMSNPAPIALRYALRMNPQPVSVYGKYTKAIDDLFAAGKDTKSEEMKKAIADLDAFKPEVYVASGPFIMDTKSITEAQVTLTKRADAWNAGTVKIDKIVVHNGETAAATPLVLDKKIDYVTHAFPPATEAQFTAMGLRIIRFPYYTGPAIFFNYKHETYGALYSKVEFRQGLAYLIDRTAAGTVALGKSGIGVKKMAGIADNMIPAYVTADVQKKLNEYNKDAKKAEELFTKAGLKKGADGQWTDAAGKKVEFELYVPSDFADWAAAADNIAQQLTAAGFKTAVRGPAWSQYTTDMYDGKFQMGLLPWGSSTPHPTFAFQANMINYNAGGKAEPAATKQGMNYPLKQKYSGGDIDFEANTWDMAKGFDSEAQKKIISATVLAYNELLPNVPIFERYSNAPILDGDRIVGWPKDGDPLLANGSADQFITLGIVNGTIKGVGK
ncbi:MAG TPA: ABC transporter substrate-binding protein [Symbiobacteriaceae bacterium]|nr:ABC transporter substrate-binding protein [Symbiobacteriaceae bacterium]